MYSLIRKSWMLIQTKWLRWRYRNRPYHEYYAAFMKIRTAYDPRFAVGGRWEEIGQLQFDYLKTQGLQPHHKLLDFGCGSLRGGLHFIDYLDSAHYTGTDISEETLAAGRKYLREAMLEAKQPNLRVNTGLEFEDYGAEQFDFIIAQSVLTHMPKEDIETLFANVDKVMHAGSVFYATFFDGGDTYSDSVERTNFYYPFSMLEALAEKHGLQVVWDKSYHHPREQQMMRISRLVE